MEKARPLFGRTARQEITIYYQGNSVPPDTLRMTAKQADDLTTDIARKLTDARGLNGGSLITLGEGDAQSFVSVVAIAKIARHTVIEGRPRVELRQDDHGRPYLYEPSAAVAYPVDYIDPAKLEDRPTGPAWSQFAEAAYAWIDGEYDPSDGVDQRADRVKVWLPHEVERLTHVASFDGDQAYVVWLNDDATDRAELEPAATGETLQYLGEELVKQRREQA